MKLFTKISQPMDMTKAPRRAPMPSCHQYSEVREDSLEIDGKEVDNRLCVSNCDLLGEVQHERARLWDLVDDLAEEVGMVGKRISEEIVDIAVIDDVSRIGHNSFTRDCFVADAVTSIAECSSNRGDGRSGFLDDRSGLFNDRGGSGCFDRSGGSDNLWD